MLKIIEGRPRACARAASVTLLCLALPAAIAAQSDLSASSEVPFSTMHMLLERTFLKIDVLTLELRVGDETAGRLERLVAGRRYSEPLADSVAQILLSAADEIDTRQTFLRDLPLDRFIDEIRAGMRKAVRAELLEEDRYRFFSDSLPAWYAVLDERGVRDGDTQHYDIRGDTLRTTFLAEDGAVLLEQVDIGPAGPRAVLASFFAPDSVFREKLIRSLLESGGDREDARSSSLLRP